MKCFVVVGSGLAEILRELFGKRDGNLGIKLRSLEGLGPCLSLRVLYPSVARNLGGLTADRRPKTLSNPKPQALQGGKQPDTQTRSAM